MIKIDSFKLIVISNPTEHLKQPIYIIFSAHCNPSSQHHKQKNHSSLKSHFWHLEFFWRNCQRTRAYLACSTIHHLCWAYFKLHFTSVEAFPQLFSSSFTHGSSRLVSFQASLSQTLFIIHHLEVCRVTVLVRHHQNTTVSSFASESSKNSTSFFL